MKRGTAISLSEICNFGNAVRYAPEPDILGNRRSGAKLAPVLAEVRDTHSEERRAPFFATERFMNRTRNRSKNVKAAKIQKLSK